MGTQIVRRPAVTSKTTDAFFICGQVNNIPLCLSMRGQLPQLPPKRVAAGTASFRRGTRFKRATFPSLVKEGWPRLQENGPVPFDGRGRGGWFNVELSVG